MKISILGLGYIGLPTGVALANAGHDVMGFDVNMEVIDSLNSGSIHIVEENLQQAYAKVWKSKKFRAFKSLQEAEVYIIAVPTPFKQDSEQKIADLSYVVSATESIAKILKPGDLVILESTVPPETTRCMTDILVKESGLKRNDFYTAHCPERVLPGRILWELSHNDRVIGAEREESSIKAKELYDSFVTEGNSYTTDDVTAEMCKLVENTYRDINIAYANELSIICDKLGIDVFQLITLANKHPRVEILKPGVGVGGHCIAVDPWFLVERFPEEAQLIKQARLRNDYKPYWVADKVDHLLEGDCSKTIGLLGLSYKPNVDDLRESPSIRLGQLLLEKGYNVLGCEPFSNKDIVGGIKNIKLDKILEEADFLVLSVNHDLFEKEKEKIAGKPHLSIS